MKKKTILINAYTALNLGDDLFIKMLCERYPQHHFKIITNSRNAKPFEKINNLEIVQSIKKIDGLLSKVKINYSVNDAFRAKLAKQSDAVVEIGGSLFMQEGQWKNKAKNYEKSVDNSKNYFLLGSNFGPYQDSEYVETYHRIFEKINDICFRDEYSYNLFSDLNNTRVASDIVFGYQHHSDNQKMKSVSLSIIDLSWRDHLKEVEGQYLNKIVELVNQLIDHNYQVNLISFCEKQGDMRAINKVLDGVVDSKKVHVVDYQGDIESVLNVLVESYAVIASRFHAMILGWVFNSKVIPLIYSNKTLNVINDVKFDGLYHQIRDIESLDVKQVLQAIQKDEMLNVEAFREKAKEQFKQLDTYLNDASEGVNL